MSKTPVGESFTVIATGHIDHCEIPGVENAYCEWGVVSGEDWVVLNGLEEGITQTARRGRGSDPALVWNFPLDLTFKSTNAFGWPKIHFSVYGRDSFGADIIQGYGFTHIPSSPGRYNLTVHLFKPRNRSGIVSILSFLQRRPAEFKAKDHVCQSEGREGVFILNMAAAGYDDGGGTGNRGVVLL